MPEQEHPDSAQTMKILEAVIDEYPGLEFFPAIVVAAIIRTWYAAEAYNVTRHEFTEGMVKPMGVQALGYVSYKLLWRV
jgi:hypothetical protein